MFNLSGYSRNSSEPFPVAEGRASSKQFNSKQFNNPEIPETVLGSSERGEKSRRDDADAEEDTRGR
jgi:hypothetical protein